MTAWSHASRATSASNAFVRRTGFPYRYTSLANAPCGDRELVQHAAYPRSPAATPKSEMQAPRPVWGNTRSLLFVVRTVHWTAHTALGGAAHHPRATPYLPPPVATTRSRVEWRASRGSTRLSSARVVVTRYRDRESERR